MTPFERSVLTNSYQGYLEECGSEESRKRQLEHEVYVEVVDEWRGFHSSPESFSEIGFSGMLAMLGNSAKSRGVNPYDAHNLCVNAEFEARYEVA